MTLIRPISRNFLPSDLQLSEWNDIQPFFERLIHENINNAEELMEWLRKRSELEAFIAENSGRRYIAMTLDTTDEEANKNYLYFINHLQPEIAPKSHELDVKLLESPYLKDLPEKKYNIYLRSVRMNARIFREENVPLFTEIATLAQEFSSISGKMTVKFRDLELTLQQASRYLQENDRNLRNEIYTLITRRRLQDKSELDRIMDKMVALRHQVAQQAGYTNFRDYMFDALGRFDYSVQDCEQFHDSVKKHIVPLLDYLDNNRKNTMKLAEIEPYDLDTDASGLPPLKPFEGQAELIAKTKKTFGCIDPFFSDCLSAMESMKLLDLESKLGKAPGGYLYPLPETGIPFIFMNSVGSLRDLVTMVHEGGHAVHSFLSRDLELNEFKNVPSEVAELASMSMELISMEHWDNFFAGADDLQRAKLEQLDDILRTLPWVAAIDKFQHWMYTHPAHHAKAREDAWLKIHAEFGGNVVNWENFKDVRAALWQKQLHLYEVPFYYIEYGFAQLGAIALWKNYLENAKTATENYKKALSLGYTETIPEIYRAAGISFNFSESYVKSLAEFVKSKLEVM